MALGKPIVATSNAGYASVITDGEQGLLVPPHSSKALAQALKRLIDDPALRARLGASGLASVGQYDWPLVARRVMDYYIQVSGEMKPASGTDSCDADAGTHAR